MKTKLENIKKEEVSRFNIKELAELSQIKIDEKERTQLEAGLKELIQFTSQISTIDTKKCRAYNIC